MKKFMKAIAFVTVMCMALSTVAFAAGMEEGTRAELDGEKVLNITVTGAGTEQVALMVVASTAENNDFSDPLYIDQKASADGSVDFTAVLTNADVDAVDIYVGFATYAEANSSAWKIGEDVAITEPVTAITVKKAAGASDVIRDENTLKGDDQTGAGVAATFEVASPEGDIATSMIWAIRYTDAEGDKVKYTDPIDISNYNFGAVLNGSIQLGIAFLNGSDLREIAPVDITAIDAIFLFEGGEEVFTNEAADAGNKAD